MKAECIVIGAGVIGLACAREFAKSGHEVLILDANESFGMETSSRNSEVIHAGIYYPKNSLKAKFCVSGKELLYRYCAEKGINYKNMGKLIVATHPDEIPAIKKIHEAALLNGVHDISFLTKEEIANLEPDITAVAGLFSKSTGIIDSHEFMLSLLGDAEQHGATLVTKCFVAGGEYCNKEKGIRLQVRDHQNEFEISAKMVINAAGLNATQVASSIIGMPRELIPKSYLCKGYYFTLSGRSPFKHLIYPAPSNAGLGIHLTLDLAGQARFGPDTEWISEIDYTAKPERAATFYDAIRRYWPGLKDGALQPGYTGIRPKIVGPKDPPGDFVIQGQNDHGLSSLINLYGIESPGLTSSLAIAKDVYKISTKNMNLISCLN